MLLNYLAKCRNTNLLVPARYHYRTVSYIRFGEYEPEVSISLRPLDIVVSNVTVLTVHAPKSIRVPI